MKTRYELIVEMKRRDKHAGREPRDLRGHQSGKLVAKDIVETDCVGKGGQYHWYCDCSCGTKYYTVRMDDLTNGHTWSCGCGRGKKRQKH